jgi:hypothetical protein
VTIGGSIALIVIGAILRYASQLVLRPREWAAHRPDLDGWRCYRADHLPCVPHAPPEARPGAFLPEWFCLRAGQLGIHRVLEGIELLVGVQRRRCS